MDNDPVLDLWIVFSENLDKFLFRRSPVDPCSDDEPKIGFGQGLENRVQHFGGGSGPCSVVDNDQHPAGVCQKYVKGLTVDWKMNRVGDDPALIRDHDVVGF